PSLAAQAVLSSLLSAQPTIPCMLPCTRHHPHPHLLVSPLPSLDPKAVALAVGPLHHPSCTEGREVARPIAAPSACVPSLGVSAHTLPASVLLSRMYTGSGAAIRGLLCQA
ncbi:hypothetical protein KI387_007763, partial [Taxus chinensis]